MSIIGEIWEERYDKLLAQLESNVKVLEESLETIKLLEAKILSFRARLNHPQPDKITMTVEGFLKAYDEHFDIKFTRQGKI